MRAAWLWVLWLLCTPAVASAQIQRTVDRVVYSVHVDVADQLDLLDLRLQLRRANALLQGAQNEFDVACCAELEAVELELFGEPGDGLDVIDSFQEWIRLGERRAIVQSIFWCGEVVSGVVGCAESPGSQLAVALDADPADLAVVIAHERGHNAGLQHRSDEFCALMSPAADQTNGCLDASECSAFRALGVGSVEQCDCLSSAIGEPPLSDGVECFESGVAGLCHSGGLCGALPANDTCEEAESLGAAGLVAEGFGALGEPGPRCQAGLPDLWYRYAATCSGAFQAEICGGDFEPVVSVEPECGQAQGISLSCRSQCPGPPLAGCPFSAACISGPVVFGDELKLRVAQRFGTASAFTLRVACDEDPNVDTDADGLADVLEYGSLGTDPRSADSDGDGLSDGVEVQQAGTNPLAGDSDGDGLGDASEWLGGASDPLDADSDDDGAADPTDNCALVANSDQADAGGLSTGAPDGIGDACQCGDVDADGLVLSSDVATYREWLAGLLPSRFVTEKCQIQNGPGPATCNLRQLVVLARATNPQPAPPGVEQVCPAAFRPRL